LLVRNRP